jgi:hypothetical protein
VLTSKHKQGNLEGGSKMVKAMYTVQYVEGNGKDINALLQSEFLCL